MKAQFKTEREQLYGGPLTRGKRFHYVVSLNGEQVATGETREAAEQEAVEKLLGALRCQQTTLYASITRDGHVMTTREYAPGMVELAHHRDESGRQGGSMLSQLELLDEKTYEKRRVSIAEFHRHYLDSYNRD